MKRFSTALLRAFPCLLFLITVIPAHSAPSIGSYTNALVNPRISPVSGSTDWTSAAVEHEYQGEATVPLYNGTPGQYVFRNVGADVYAQSNLSAAELKARAKLALSESLVGSADNPPAGVAAVSVLARAAFADSFSFEDGAASKYMWQDDEVFHFNFSIHGETALLSAPIYSGSPPVLTSGASMTLSIYSPGAIQAMHDGQYDVAHSLLTGLYLWCLGPTISGPDFCGPNVLEDGMTRSQIDLDENGMGYADLAFSPGGDFEFTLSLSAFLSIDLSLEDVSGLLDFSNTLKVGILAPSDANVFSASGLFPGTQLRVPDPSLSVPEPGSLALLLMALILGLRLTKSSLLSRG